MKMNGQIQLKKDTFYHVVVLDHFKRDNQLKNIVDIAAELRLDFIGCFLGESTHYFIFSEETAIFSDEPNTEKVDLMYTLKSAIETLEEIEFKKIE